MSLSSLVSARIPASRVLAGSNDLQVSWPDTVPVSAATFPNMVHLEPPQWSPREEVMGEHVLPFAIDSLYEELSVAIQADSSNPDETSIGSAWINLSPKAFPDVYSSHAVNITWFGLDGDF